MRRPDKIAVRIWLSLGILICGYFISMIVGFVLGRSAELRLQTVSNSLFPAAKQSQLAHINFREQIENYNDAVLLGEESFISSSKVKSREVVRHLEHILSLPGLKADLRSRVDLLRESLAAFSAEALPVYSDLSSYLDFLSQVDTEDAAAEKEALEEKAFKLAKQTEFLNAELERLSEDFSNVLRKEIADINSKTLRQRYLNLVVFVVVVVVSVALIVVIVTQSISRPLRRTFMLEKAVEQSEDGIIVTDLNGRINFVNRAWAVMHGYVQNELIGEQIHVFHSAKQVAGELDPFLKRVGERGAYTGEVGHLHKNGTEFISMMSMTLLTDDSDNQVKMVGIARDITEQKKSEQELRQAKEEAEEANKALQESLAVLKKTQAQLVQSEKMASLGGLVAGVSHEINTPLGVGVTASSFLEEKTRELTKIRAGRKATDDEVEKYLNVAAEASTIILKNLNRAASLVRSFKQVAVDQSGETRRTFNFKDYLDELLVSLRPKYKRTPHTVAVHCPDDIEIDSYPGAFSQVLTNLMMNSLTHGLDGVDSGTIDINVEVDNGQLRLIHRDNGRGMDEKTRKQVFDPFFTTRRGMGGTGLGLNIVYNLVTRTLGGQITCQSNPDQGTAFIIHVPIHRPKNVRDEDPYQVSKPA